MNYKELLEVIEKINAVVGNAETKSQKKLIKIYEKLKPIYEQYIDERNDYRLDAAAVDDKGNVVVDEKGDYKFTKESLKTLQVHLKNLLEKEIDFKKITVVNPGGLEDFYFLKDVVTGVEFILTEDEEL
jgi:hypothetical protein